MAWTNDDDTLTTSTPGECWGRTEPLRIEVQDLLSDVEAAEKELLPHTEPDVNADENADENAVDDTTGEGFMYTGVDHRELFAASGLYRSLMAEAIANGVLELEHADLCKVSNELKRLRRQRPSSQVALRLSPAQLATVQFVAENARQIYQRITEALHVGAEEDELLKRAQARDEEDDPDDGQVDDAETSAFRDLFDRRDGEDKAEEEVEFEERFQIDLVKIGSGAQKRFEVSGTMDWGDDDGFRFTFEGNRLAKAEPSCLGL